MKIYIKNLTKDDFEIIKPYYYDLDILKLNLFHKNDFKKLNALLHPIFSYIFMIQLHNKILFKFKFSQNRNSIFI